MTLRPQPAEAQGRAHRERLLGAHERQAHARILEGLKGTEFIGDTLTVMSSLGEGQLEQLDKLAEAIAENISQNKDKNSAKISKNLLTISPPFGILFERAGVGLLRLSRQRDAMKREIAARAGNFRGVCPASQGARNRAAELFSCMAYIACAGRPAKSRFVFRAGPDTHGCVYEKTAHRTNGRWKPPKYEIQEEKTWQQTRK